MLRYTGEQGEEVQKGQRQEVKLNNQSIASC